MKNTVTTPYQTYNEDDLYCAAAIATALKLPVLRIVPSGDNGRCVFVFERHSKIESTRDAYFRNDLSLDAYGFSLVLKELKRRLHAATR
jgi:hypothetical protein